ncbi:hypothetical protein [Enterococcus dispar]
MNIKKIMQITVKPGIHIIIGMNNFEEYKDRRLKIINSRNEFVDITDKCTLRRSDIVAIEYFEKEVADNEKSDVANTK